MFKSSIERRVVHNTVEPATLVTKFPYVWLALHYFLCTALVSAMKE
jgi:hypothetical protein